MKVSCSAALILCFASMSSAVLAEECLLNQEYFHGEAQALVRRHAGAKYIGDERLVRWDSSDLGRISVIVGGCESFGLESSSERRVIKPSSREAVLKIAKRLARLGWPEPYGREAESVLSTKPRVEGRKSGGLAFEYDAPDYMEFAVSQSFDGTVEKITVSAIHLQ
ncbi:hypothetical protein QRD43_21880 [Pelomonas sp. APW6]|uniref:PepSY domain-containing protein n=1 Tax=Roseateles subflavus TaxID=3053353 RepID=A0ABT7LR07_9BURK|nr:hypothetical protein [Pelomonas sp. APW6]MDL5034570.1 hypothetical protein [Pelomonas sp. APW6]